LFGFDRQPYGYYIVHEGDEPDPVADLRHTDVLARENVTEIDFATVETDPAA
jgi:hypothetical protein